MERNMTKVDIKSLDYQELQAYVAGLGEKSFRGKQIYQWMHEKLAESYDEMSNLSKALRTRLEGETVYISFSSRLLEYVAEFDPTAAVGFLTSTVSDSSIQAALGLRNGSNYVFINASDYSETAVSLCQSASIPLEVWTIDSPAVIKGLSPYISGVTSNRYHAGRVREE